MGSSLKDFVPREKPFAITDIAQGLAEGAVKIGFDTLNTGVLIGNTIQGMRADADELQPFLRDDTQTYWDVTKNLRDTDVSVYTKGTAEITAFIGSSVGIASKIAKMPKFLELAKRQGSLANIGKDFIAGAASDVMHTRAADQTLTEMFTNPEDRGVFLDFFVGKVGDSELEGRLRHVLEGGALGVMVDKVVESLRASKAMLHRVSETPNELRSNVHEVLADMDNVDEIEEAIMRTTPGAELIPEDARLPTITRRAPTEEETAKAVKTKGADAIATAVVDTDPLPKVPKTGVRRLDTKAIEANERKVMAVAKSISSNESDTMRVVKEILGDPNATKEEIKAAKDMQKLYQEGGYNLMNHKVHGSFVSEEMVRTFESIGVLRKMGLGGKKIIKRSNLQIQAAGLKKFEEGGTIESIKLFKALKDDGYTLDNMKRLISASTAAEHEIQEGLSAMMSVRHAMAEDFAKAAKAMLKGDFDMQSPLGKDMMNAFGKLDQLDSVIDGKASMTGRTLNLLKTDPNSEMGRLVSRELNYTDMTKKAEEAGVSVEEIMHGVQQKDTVLTRYLVAMDNKQEKLLKKFLADVASGKVRTVGEMNKALSAGTLFEAWQAFLRGSLLSSIGSITKSVITGNAIATGYKNIIAPVFQASVGKFMKTVGGDDAGMRAAQGMIGLQSSLRATKNGLKAIFEEGSIKQGMGKVFNVIGDVTREGVDDFNMAKKSAVREKLEILSEYYSTKGSYKTQKMIDLMTPIWSSVMGIQNTFIRGIANSDTFFKGVSTEATLDRKAHEAWYRVGEALGEDNMETFIDNFSKLQREVISIDSADIAPKAAEALLNKAFKGINPGTKDEILRSIASAKGVAEEASLQTDLNNVGGGVGLLNSLLQGGNKMAEGTLVGKVLMTSVFPFQKTPIVLLKEVQDHSIMAFTSKRFLKTLTSGTPTEQIEVLSKVAGGTLFAAGIVGLAAQGRISGTSGPQELGKTTELKIPESSFLVGDTWINYSAMGPFAVLMDAAANFVRLRQKDDKQNYLTFLSMSMTVASQEGHLATMGQLLDMAQSDNVITEGATFVIGRTANALVPLQALSRSVSSTIDNGVYRTSIDQELNGLVGFMTSKVASGLKGHLIWREGMNGMGFGMYENDYSLLGDDLYKHSGDMGSRAMHLLGFTNNTRQTSRWRIEMANAGLVPNNSRSSSVDSVKLTSNEFKNMQRATTHGDYDVDGEMNALVNSELYRSSGPTPRKRLLNDAYQRFLGVQRTVFKEESKRFKAVKKQIDTLKLLNWTKDESAAPIGSTDWYLESRTASRRLNITDKQNLRDMQTLLDMRELKDVLKIKGTDNAK